MTVPESPGRRLVEAVAAKDHAALRDLLDPAVDFRGMTPRRFWEGGSPDDVCTVLSQWFDDGDHIQGIEQLAVETFADVEHVGYRLSIETAGRLHVAGQQAYLTTVAGRITWLRIMCAGFRPVDPGPDHPEGA